MNTSTSQSRIILSITRLISYGCDNFEIINNDQMHLWCNPFWRPSWCAGMIQHTSSNGGGPWLTRKPLDTTTRWAFTSYCPSGRQGDNKWNNNKKCTIISSHFDSYADAPVQYRAHRPIEVVQGSIEITSHHHWVSIAANNCNWSPIRQVFWVFSSSTSCYKRDQAVIKAPKTNRDMAYQIDRKEFSNTMWYLFGDAKLVD